jgi:sugar phosphate isomerase/epimerase
MNYAFMSFSCPELGLCEMLQMAREYGYVAVEPRSQSGHGHGIEFDASPGLRAEIRASVSDSRVDLCCLATSCMYADPASVAGHIEDSRLAIDLAADIGCPRIRVFGGKIGEGLEREDAIEQVAVSLAALGDQAAECGVSICMETHDDWCDPKHVAAVMRMANHPHVCVNWDILHPVRSGNLGMREAYGILKPWIRHVHVHDGFDPEPGKFEFCAIGEGVADHESALRCLKDANYSGYISGEWIDWEPHAVHLPRELKMLKQMEAGL